MHTYLIKACSEDLHFVVQADTEDEATQKLEKYLGLQEEGADVEPVDWSIYDIMLVDIIK